MSVEFKVSEKSFSATLRELSESLPAESISVRELLSLIGEQGMLLFAMILTIPFLTPIPLPGVSTVFGLIIMLIAAGVVFNRIPWLPNFLMKRSIRTEQLRPVLLSGVNLFQRVEGIIRPRLSVLTAGAAINRLNGLWLFIGGALLILPLPMLPFSNTIPGWAVLFIAAGILQRDGLLILLGLLLNIVAITYFGIVALLLIFAGGRLSDLFREHTPGLMTFLRSFQR